MSRKRDLFFLIISVVLCLTLSSCKTRKGHKCKECPTFSKSEFFKKYNSNNYEV